MNNETYCRKTDCFYCQSLLRTDLKNDRQAFNKTMNIYVRSDISEQNIAREDAFQPGYIIDTVSEYLGVSSKAIIGDMRYKNIQEARHIAIYFCQRYTHLKCADLGKIFNRTHSTIIYSYHLIQGYVSVDKVFAKKIEMVKRHLIASRYLTPMQKLVTA